MQEQARGGRNTDRWLLIGVLSGDFSPLLCIYDRTYRIYKLVQNQSAYAYIVSNALFSFFSIFYSVNPFNIQLYIRIQPYKYKCTAEDTGFKYAISDTKRVYFIYICTVYTVQILISANCIHCNYILSLFASRS